LSKLSWKFIPELEYISASFSSKPETPHYSFHPCTFLRKLSRITEEMKTSQVGWCPQVLKMLQSWWMVSELTSFRYQEKERTQQGLAGVT
jgi:hypothetical protein